MHPLTRMVASVEIVNKATAGVALSLLLRKPKQQEEDGTAGGDNPDPAMMGH
jgi:hypothetical protein